MRKAFNFYRSYWEAAEDLKPLDRLAYYEALMKRQFTGEEVELKGLAKIVYKGQKHSIDAQVFGYEAKTKAKLTPCQGGVQGGTQGGSQPPSVQEKEKEKEKEKGKVEQAMHPLVQWLNDECPDVQKMKEPLTDQQAIKILQQYPGAFARQIFNAMDNHKPLVTKNKSAYKTFLNWASRNTNKQQDEAPPKKRRL